MKQTYTVPVRLSEELVRKLIVISEAEGRTPNNQFILMLRNNIAYYERTKGRISPQTLAAVDLSPYTDQPAPAAAPDAGKTEE